jgi:peroxiredoxin 2/4
MSYHPLTTGRDTDEILRPVDALRATEANKVATPANWSPGGRVIVPPSRRPQKPRRRLRGRRLVLCRK